MRVDAESIFPAATVLLSLLFVVVAIALVVVRESCFAVMNPHLRSPHIFSRSGASKLLAATLVLQTLMTLFCPVGCL